jgi:hypothetical protein
MINKPEGDIRKINFWDVNPNYKILFDEFFESDKTKDKAKSSTIMWAFYLVLHPNSDFYNLPDKRRLVKDKFVKDKAFKWETYSKQESLFKESSLTQAERSLYEWNEYMRKRDEYLKKQDYFFDYFDKTGKLVKGTAEQLDKAYGVTPKMYADYDKIQKSLKEEDYKTGKGNKIKSLTDAKEI